MIEFIKSLFGFSGGGIVPRRYKDFDENYFALSVTEITAYKGKKYAEEFKN